MRSKKRNNLNINQLQLNRSLATKQQKKLQSLKRYNISRK